MRNEKKNSFLMVWMPAGKPLDSYLILGNKSIYSPKVINSVTKWGNDIKMIIFVHFNNLVTELYTGPRTSKFNAVVFLVLCKFCIT